MPKMPRNIFPSIVNFFVNKSSLILAFCLGLLVTHFRTPTCPSKDLVRDNSFFVAVLVLSSPDNVDRRNAIRETWLNLRPRIINNSFYNSEVIFLPKVTRFGVEPETVEDQRQLLHKYREWMNLKTQNIKVGDYKVRHFFAIGTKDLDRTRLKAIQAEQDVFSDLLLLPDLVDTYANLTDKLLASIAFIDREISYKYLLKCDDDTYVRLDTLSQDLLDYHAQMEQRHPDIGLYWGYFNGRANIKTQGKWKELNYTLCDKYLPYALGGGYVISHSVAAYLTSQRHQLATYLSEDISMGTWLSPFKNIHRRHDVRFDTGYTPRPCRPYHLVFHKKNPEDMTKLYKGVSSCELPKQPGHLKEYFYDWYQSPSKCCDNVVVAA